MSPLRTLATERKSAKRSRFAGVRRVRKSVPSCKNIQEEAVRSLNTSVVDFTPSGRNTRSSTQALAVPLLNTSTVTFIPPEPRGRKRGRESEKECLDKRRRKDSQPAVGSVQPIKRLNRKNLEELNRQTGSQTSDRMGDKKRSLSRRSSNAEMYVETASAASQRSSLAHADYRLRILSRTRIFVRHGSLPENVRSRIDAIVQSEISRERKSEVIAITNTLCNAFPGVLEAASREDDAVELVYRALESMYGEKFALRRKADWDPSLKPTVQRKFYDFSPHKSNEDTEDPLNRTSKRQQAETSYVSPERSGTTMPPPPPPPPPPPAPLKQDAPIAKTPRPDITLGFPHAVIAMRLRALGLSELDADEFLQDLQDNQNLCFSPTQSALLIHFPPMVVEGKSYATGKTIYEAQNQAAVSGSCMLNLQHRLADLTERLSPGSHQSKDPLAFTICTEGPSMELWVHYTASVQGARFWNMNIVLACHASIPSMVGDFFMTVEGVMRWASSELLDDIAEQLVLVWKAVQQPPS